jgi:hypothetical protein
MLKLIEHSYNSNVININLKPDDLPNRAIETIFANIRLPTYRIKLTHLYDTDMLDIPRVKGKDLTYDNEICKNLLEKIDISFENSDLPPITISNQEWFFSIGKDIPVLKNNNAEKEIYLKIPIIFNDFSKLLNQILFGQRNKYEYLEIKIKVYLCEFEDFLKNNSLHDQKLKQRESIETFGFVSQKYQEQKIKMINKKCFKMEPILDYQYSLKINSKMNDNVYFYFDKQENIPQIFLMENGSELYMNNICEMNNFENIVTMPSLECIDYPEYLLKFKSNFFKNKKGNLRGGVMHIIWFTEINPLIKNSLYNALQSKNIFDSEFCIYNQKVNLPEIEATDKCSITHEEFLSGEKVQRCITCKHVFKYESIKKWLAVLVNRNEEIRCPYCRNNLGEEYCRIA